MPKNNGRERKEARRKSANARRVAFEEALKHPVVEPKEEV